ncbi:MAG: hypothetical protein ACKOJF_00290, partial [Planctomycetaceae bacterium]
LRVARGLVGAVAHRCGAIVRCIVRVAVCCDNADQAPRDTQSADPPPLEMPPPQPGQRSDPPAEDSSARPADQSAAPGDG